MRRISDDEDGDSNSAPPQMQITAADFQLVSDARPLVAAVQRTLLMLAAHHTGTVGGEVLKETSHELLTTMDTIIDHFLERELRL